MVRRTGVGCVILLRIKNLVLFFVLWFFLLLYSVWAFPPTYSESAHGSSVYGVDRISGISKGNCAHCHEQHKGDSGPYPYLLFDSPTGDKYFCFNCHTNGGVINRSYSYRAGGYIQDTVDDIEEEFNLFSKHNLSDILDFINDKWLFSSQYSSPCVACHDPHYAQRSFPLRLPSKHKSIANSDRLWGDETEERMSSYVGNKVYQAPYRYGSTTSYEPDGSNIDDGSNMADFDTFCLICHVSDMNSYGLTHTPIDWSSAGDKHGLYEANGDASLKPPYDSNATGVYVLSCTDCHEPHGSPNLYLIRVEINGDVLGQTITDFSGKSMGYICRRCHTDDEAISGDPNDENKWHDVHHSKSDSPLYNVGQCGSCHGGDLSCINCHYHGGEYNGEKTF